MDKVECCKIAAKIHKKVRKELYTIIKPGIKLLDICNYIENRVKVLTKNHGNQVNGGIAFPTGISLNNIAAHWTPYVDDASVLKESDVCKIDFGVQINGWIIDSAFTVNLDKKYQKLMDASKEAVSGLINHIGCDMLISELGEISEEIVKSYEIEVNGKLTPILPISNLTGHSIDQWKIHAGKSIINVKNNSNERIDGDEFFAIEVFTSTGNGVCKMADYSNHFMLKDNPKKNIKLKLKRSYECLNFLKSNFNTLAFCPRFIYNINSSKKYDLCFNDLFNNGLLNSYPPVYDVIGSHTAQFEHTIYISDQKKIILSKSDDY